MIAPPFRSLHAVRVPFLFCLFRQSSFFYSQLPWPLNGNSFMSRLLLGWCVGERNLRGCVESSQMHARFERTRIVQDAQVPLHHLAPFLNWTLSDVGVSPMWLCPVLGSESDVLAPNYVHIGSAHNSALGFHYVNVGCYGRPTNSQLPHADLQAAFIQNVYQAGGRTLLHAHNWHTPHLWSQMFNRKPYDAVRKKYGATEAYPHAYDKVRAISSRERKDGRGEDGLLCIRSRLDRSAPHCACLPALSPGLPARVGPRRPERCFRFRPGE